jgi:hypothetical protein
MTMTIIRSVGVTTLVALMSAHRAASELRGAAGFDQDMVEAIDAYLRGLAHRPEPVIEPPRSYN